MKNQRGSGHSYFCKQFVGKDVFRLILRQYMDMEGQAVGQFVCREWRDGIGRVEDGRDLCDEAAWNGHPHILEWARAQGCPWGPSTCTYAAGSGNLETLQWLRERGCPWDEVTCFHATMNGHLCILQWAVANGCDWDRQVCLMEARDNGHQHIVDWIEKYVK